MKNTAYPSGRSPLVRGLLLLFVAFSLFIILLLAGLLLARGTAKPAETHVPAQRIDALRWWQGHLADNGEGGTGTPCRGSENLCAAAENLNRLLAASGSPRLIRIGEDDISNASAGENRARLETAKILLETKAIDGESLEKILRDSLAPDHGVHGNPFRLRGCLYGHASGSSSADVAGRADRHCIHGTPIDLQKHFPPGLDPLRKRLADWRQPWNGLIPNPIDGLAAGRDLWLTLDPSQQRLAQQTADCYTGHGDPCAGAWWYTPRHAADLFESARARSVGIVLVDARSGAIRAMAGAHTPCFVARALDRPLPADCPRLPPDIARPDRLANPGIEAEMPGSALKPLQALALLAAGTLSAREKAALPEILRRSDTEAMIDLYFCQAADFDSSCIARRLAALEKQLARSGFNRCRTGVAGCRAEVDLLGPIDAPGSDKVAYHYRDGEFTRRSEALSQPVFAARALRDRQGQSLVARSEKIDRDALRDCYRDGDAKRWRGCHGAELVDLVAELYGQGNARASIVGLAQGWLDLAAAADRRAQAPVPHLVAAYQDASGTRHVARQRHEHRLATADARHVLAGLEKVVGSGSAARACAAAAAAGGRLRCRPKAGDVRIAAKTGTPLFPPARSTAIDQLAAWRAACAEAAAVGCAAQRPLKWFVALVAPQGQGNEFLVLVRAERNFHRHGRLDDADDSGGEGNVAAEIGLALTNALITPAEKTP